MSRSKWAAVCRLSVIVSCLFPAIVVCGQNPAPGTTTRPPLNERYVVNRVPTTYVAPPKVPPLFGLNRNEVGRVLEPLSLQAKFSGPENGIVVAQEPAAETSVPYGTVIAVTLGVLPRLVLTGPDLPAYAGRELTFSATFDPPLPLGTRAIYTFRWNDNTPDVEIDRSVATHQFTEGQRTVSVLGVIDDRFKVGSDPIAFDVVAALPTSDTTQSTMSTSTDSQTIGTTSTEVQAGSQATDTTPSTTTAPTTTDVQTSGSATVATVQTTGTRGGGEGTESSQTTLLLIWAAATLLLLTLVIVRALRGAHQELRETQATTKLPLEIKGRIGSIEHEIQHPEQIRRGLTVRLRGGIRRDADGEGGANA
jgi:hypothetical protein